MVIVLTCRFSSTMASRCGIFCTMPRKPGVSGLSTTRLIFFRPERSHDVSCASAGVQIGLRTNLILIVPSAIMHRSSGLVYSFSTGRPRMSATALLSRNCSSASMVAFTTLCGLCEPIDFVSTFGMPTAWMTARTGPPAITPVPSGAGFSSTSPLPKRPRTVCRIVVSRTLIFRRFFLAASMPFLIADGTSLALPVPNPQPSPTGRPRRPAPRSSVLTALDHFRDAVDADDLFLQIQRLRVNALAVGFAAIR